MLLSGVIVIYFKSVFVCLNDFLVHKGILATIFTTTVKETNVLSSIGSWPIFLFFFCIRLDVVDWYILKRSIFRHLYVFTLNNVNTGYPFLILKTVLIPFGQIGRSKLTRSV